MIDIDEEVIESMRALIDHPSAENAIEIAYSRLCTCWMADYDKERSCGRCAWEPICQMYQADPSLITDEMLSAMVLDAMKLLAICEAEHD